MQCINIFFFLSFNFYSLFRTVQPSAIERTNEYRYAMTFRLTVIRSAWVYDAWEQRNNPEFKAKNKTFTDQHRLKAFEGQRICFFGFAPDEHQHMIDVLKMNGGIATDLEDPDCTHVVS